MEKLLSLVIFFGFLICAIKCGFHDEQVWSIAGISGSSTSLPCPLNPRKEGDTPKLILWYKRGNKTPLFSYDSRLPSRKSNGQMTIDPNSARLTFNKLTIDDAGFYECRVDFYHSPTNTNLVNLTVIEPPYSVEIFDKFTGSAKNGVLGPYQEGESIILTCLARGGTPKPNITWWNADSVLTETSPEVEGVSPHLVQSDLFLQKLSRNWHNRSLTCTGDNSRLVTPVVTSVVIIMYLWPTSVTVSYEKPAMEGMKLQLICITQGSRPGADLSWSIRGGLPISERAQVTRNTKSTTSIVTLPVSKEENGKEIVCEATNPAIPESSLSNSSLLIVHYAPTAKALLGPSYNPDLLKEGDDVYFVCEVDSNPKADEIKWFHEGVKLFQKVSDGVLLSGNSLVLQRVSRRRAGKYTCLASNYLGSVTSSPVFLKVKYKPECISSHTTYFIYDQPINVTCSVSSHPFATKMHWRWNSGSDVMNIRPFSSSLERTSKPMTEDEIRATGRLTVYPSKNSEDRELSCWAQNEMGAQRIPCSFSIKVAQIPAPLTSCRLANITASSLSLSCEKPRGASTDATFYRAELYLHNRTLFANVTSPRPSFNVSRLDPGTSYQIKVYVSRGPVTSLPVVVSASTFRRSRVEASTSGNHSELPQRIVCVLLLFILWIWGCPHNLELMKIPNLHPSLPRALSHRKNSVHRS